MSSECNVPFYCSCAAWCGKAEIFQLCRIIKKTRGWWRWKKNAYHIWCAATGWQEKRDKCESTFSAWNVPWINTMLKGGVHIILRIFKSHGLSATLLRLLKIIWKPALIRKSSDIQNSSISLFNKALTWDSKNLWTCLNLIVWFQMLTLQICISFTIIVRVCSWSQCFVNFQIISHYCSIAHHLFAYFL